MVGEPEPFLDRRPHALGQLGCTVRIGACQEHGDRIFGVARDPVVLAEILPDQDPEPLENLVADAVAVLLVDGRQVIDVEENQRNRIAEPAARSTSFASTASNSGRVCSVVSLSMIAVSLGSSCARSV